jgi:tetratricopeptide (TPR) repeat protein
MTDVFAVQEEVAAAVIEAIVPAARSKATNSVSPSPTRDIAAYDLYLLGRAAQEARTDERLRESIDYFERAVRLDPDYAKAHAGLSRSLMLWHNYGDVPPLPDAQKRAEAAAYRALAIDPELSDGHAALGTALRERDPARAEESYKRALELNPNNVTALWDYGTSLNNAGRPADQDALVARVRKLDPRLAIAWASAIGNLLSEGKIQEFRAEYAQALVALADDPDGLNLVARSARFLGRAPEAYRVAFAIEQAGNLDLALVGAVVPHMLIEDYSRARALAELRRRRGLDPAQALQFSLALAGASSDWLAVDAIARDIAALGLTDPVSLGPIAFWLAVQERYVEAAAVYARIGPLPERGSGGLGGALLGGSQGLPALLRTYRATGRADEAQKLAARYLASLRSSPPEEQDEPHWHALDLAALAANEGHEDEAVAALRTAFKLGHLVWGFDPRLPWFRSLESHPGYAEILAERQRRIDQARTEMRAIEAQFPDSVIVKTIRSAQQPNFQKE